MEINEFHNAVVAVVSVCACASVEGKDNSDDLLLSSPPRRS